MQQSRSKCCAASLWPSIPAGWSRCGATYHERCSAGADDRHPGRFIGKVKLYPELTHIAFQRGDAGVIFDEDAGLGVFTCLLATVELRQSELNEIGRDVMAVLSIWATDDARPDVLTELRFERHRMPTVGTSGPHGVSSMQGPSSESDP